MPAAHRVVPGIFGQVVGTLHGAIHNGNQTHLFIPLYVPAGSGAGMWQLAVNVQTGVGLDRIQYRSWEETIASMEVPAPGFYTGLELSYANLANHGVFENESGGRLRDLVSVAAQGADWIAAYGFTFPGGLHDIHCNNGEPPGTRFPNRPGQDGALVLYFRRSARRATRRWILLKFESQIL